MLRCTAPSAAARDQQPSPRRGLSRFSRSENGTVPFTRTTRSNGGLPLPSSTRHVVHDGASWCSFRVLRCTAPSAASVQHRPVAEWRFPRENDTHGARWCMMVQLFACCTPGETASRSCAGLRPRTTKTEGLTSARPSSRDSKSEPAAPHCDGVGASRKSASMRHNEASFAPLGTVPIFAQAKMGLSSSRAA